MGRRLADNVEDQTMTESEPDAHLITRTEARIDDLQLRTKTRALLNDLVTYKLGRTTATARLRVIDAAMADLADLGLTSYDLARHTGIHEATIRKHIRRHKERPVDD